MDELVKSSALDFYGIGSVELSSKNVGADEMVLPRSTHAFGLTVRGDLDGIFILLTDCLPVEDPSSGLELLNVLAAKAIEELSGSGIDLLMSSPRELSLRVQERFRASELVTHRLWQGRFNGPRDFSFELCLLAGRGGALLTDWSLYGVPSHRSKEEEECSEHSSDS